MRLLAASLCLVIFAACSGCGDTSSGGSAPASNSVPMAAAAGVDPSMGAAPPPVSSQPNYGSPSTPTDTTTSATAGYPAPSGAGGYSPTPSGAGGYSTPSGAGGYPSTTTGAGGYSAPATTDSTAGAAGYPGHDAAGGAGAGAAGYSGHDATGGATPYAGPNSTPSTTTGTATTSYPQGYPSPASTPAGTASGSPSYPNATPATTDTTSAAPTYSYPNAAPATSGATSASPTYPNAAPATTDASSASPSYGYPTPDGTGSSTYPGSGQPGGADRIDPEVEENRKKIDELFQERTWSDATGKYNFKGKFMDYTSGKVTLQRSGAEQNVTLEMKQLSESDQKYIREGLKAQADQKKREEQQRIRDLRRRPRDGNNPYGN